MSDTRTAKEALLYLFVFAAAALEGGCSAFLREVFKPPKVHVTDVALASNPFENPGGAVELLLTLAVDNRNDYDLNVADITYSAVIGKENVAEGEFRENVRIAAASTTTVRVPLRVRPEAFRAAFRQILAARAIPYEFNGSIGLRAPVAGVVRVPFSKTGALDPVEFLRKRGLGLN